MFDSKIISIEKNSKRKRGRKLKKLSKLIAIFVAGFLVFSPIGDVVFQEQPQTVEAKKRGGGGFAPKSGINKNNNIQDRQSNTNRSNNSPAQTNRGGGFMRGLMLGGLAGMLFGGLLGGWGILGSLLGMLINIGAILLIVWLIVKVFKRFRNANGY
jgi:predicted lipid-binding transport protein (Tim44 family)